MTGPHRLASGRAFGVTLLVACLISVVRIEDDRASNHPVGLNDVELPPPHQSIDTVDATARVTRPADNPRTAVEDFDLPVRDTATPWFGTASAELPEVFPPAVNDAVPLAAPARTPAMGVHDPMPLPMPLRGTEVSPIAPEESSLAPVRAPALAPPGAVMRSLYLGFGVLQGLDVYTTRVALRSGAREANPLMMGLAERPVALVAAKAAATFGTVYLVERLRIRNRVAAVITMAALDSAYAMLVVRNARVARAQRERSP